LSGRPICLLSSVGTARRRCCRPPGREGRILSAGPMAGSHAPQRYRRVTAPERRDCGRCPTTGQGS
jgi:hypothetical protein